MLSLLLPIPYKNSMHSGKLLLAVSLLAVSTLFCPAFAQSGPDQAAEETELSTLELLPEHWRHSIIKEPVMHSELFVVEAGKPNSPALLFIHGLGKVGVQDWLSSMQSLEDDYRVIGIDLPGFGLSSDPVGLYSPENYAATLAWLMHQKNIAKVTAIGHSMGGAVALKFAHRHPNLVERLVLVDAAGILHKMAFTKHFAKVPASIERFPKFIQKRLYNLQDLAASLIENTKRFADFSEHLAANETLWGVMLRNHPNTNAALGLIEQNFSKSISEVTQPTFIVWGEDDPVAPLRTGQMLAGRMDRARLMVIPDAGHVPMKSHFNAFIPLLKEAVSTHRLPPSTKAVQTEKPIVSQDKLLCRNEVGLVYTGEYESVTIEDCVAIRLVDVKAKQITIHNSTVSILNSRFRGIDYVGDFLESVVTATNSSFITNQALRVSASRLDFAGVTVKTQKTLGEAIEIDGPSRVIFSVSDIKNYRYTAYMHGDYKMQAGNLAFLFNHQSH